MGKIIKGSSLLLVTSLIVKVLSAVYRIPFQNIVGNEGFYIYQQVYPIYALGMTISLTGIPLYISKYVVEFQNDKQKIQQLFTLLLIGCTFIFLFIYFSSSIIAKLMGDINLVPLIKVSSFIFLLSPCLAMYRGIYQGNLYLTPTAMSQLLEQVIRVAVILVSSIVLVSLNVSLYKVGTMAMIGSIAGSFVALIVLYLYSVKKKMGFFKWKLPTVALVKETTKEGLLLVLTVSYLLLFQLIDSFLISNRLQDAGLSLSQSRNLKGIFDRGQPMVQVGLVFTMVFIQALLPLLAKAIQKNDKLSFMKYQKLLYKLLFLIALPVTLGLVVLMPNIDVLLFEDVQGVRALRIFGLSIFLISSLQCFQSIDQSLKKTKTLWFALLSGLIAKLICTYVLTFYYGICGASLGTICGLIVANLLYMLLDYRKITCSKQFFVKYVIILLIYLACLIIFQAFLGHSLSNRFSALCLSFAGIFGNGILLLFLIIKSKIFSREEWAIIPLGEKIVKIMGCENEN